MCIYEGDRRVSETEYPYNPRKKIDPGETSCEDGQTRARHFENTAEYCRILQNTAKYCRILQ
jgi:hypothetical protein